MLDGDGNIRRVFDTTGEDTGLLLVQVPGANPGLFTDAEDAKAYADACRRVDQSEED